MKTVLKYYRKYLPIMGIIVLALFLQGICELLLPRYMSDIINNGIVPSDMEHIEHVGIIMVGIAALSSAGAITANFFSARTAAKTAQAIRRDLFHTVTSFSAIELNRFSTASLITRSTNDVQMIQQVTVMALRIMIFAPIMGIGAVIMALKTSVPLSWTIGLALICVCGLMVFMFIVALPKFKVMQEKLDRINLVMKERLSGTLVVRAFLRESAEEERFDEANRDLTGLYISVNRYLAFMLPTMTFIMSGVGILIIWVGAHLVDANQLLIGDMLAYLQYAMHVIMSFMFVTMIFIMLPRAAVSANRIGEILDTEISIRDKDDLITVDQVTEQSDDQVSDERVKDHRDHWTVEFRDVSFHYPDSQSNALSNISFTARQGETTAIIGGTGSGKSTIVNLIPRFYEVSDGELLVGGMDVRDMSQEELRKHIGLVPQKGTLFSGTIESNLKFGNAKATREDLMEAMEIAQATEFISERPEGIESEIAQGGSNVSGGQKQRLCIARALVKKPEIMVFDDSFSALDFSTDKALRAALKQKLKDCTFIIVAQRINTIIDADQIIVLDEGCIVGKGTHRELLESCTVYREIALSQLSEDELLNTGEKGGEANA